jgi:cyclophilin family peptidyl-prolyl cis-trans isomerase/HEAT repeat protein
LTAPKRGASIGQFRTRSGTPSALHAMLHLLIPLFIQAAPQQRILQTENARSDEVAPLLAAVAGTDTRLQRLAVRAIGRLERPSLRDAVVPLLTSPDAGVRMEAVNALGQMGAGYAYGPLLTAEKDGRVRAVIYETVGRVTPVADESERLVVRGLADPDLAARTGAARGVESLFRLNRSLRPTPATITALRQAFRDNSAAALRELALLALNAARDRDSATFALALRDTSPQVRRLAVIGSAQWVNDPSPMVRYESMRLAATCQQAIKGADDVSELVALAAVDVLGNRKCDARAIEPLVESARSWRVRAHALVSLAKVAPDAARPKLARLAADPVWQARVYAATAAKLVKDDATLATLARDREPNVAAEAITSVDDAVRGLASDHAGLLLASARRLQGAPELPGAMHQVLAALTRITRDGRATMRDPRTQLLERVRESGDSNAVNALRVLLADIDPAIATLAADIISQKTGTKVEPRTTRYVPAPLPSAETLRALDGATAVVTMKGLGTFTLELLTDDAPVTVATFARLADEGRFNGLTFHRMVPNFVIQGGSPGADEYDGLTSEFLRDEMGLARHLRGSLGISTRGRDTGDGQIYVNLVDNFRLDHTYTIFARVTTGMNVVDRILEGDVIESVRIRRGTRDVGRGT